MKLSYRGVAYDYTPPKVVYGPSYAAGKYRGTPITFPTLKETPVAQPSYNLKYRGVSYLTSNTSPTSAVEKMPVVPAGTKADPRMSLLERSRALIAGHRQLIRRREQAMLTRLDQEVGLSAKDAANFEGHIQGKVCHNFRKVYDRSPAAMS